MNNTILFGNGINRLTPSNISWDELLIRLKGERKFNNGALPNTMIYERIILEKPNKNQKIVESESLTKFEIAELMSGIQPNKQYLELFNLDANHYLTTNYDYGFLNSVKDFNKDYESVDLSTEEVYSIRRERKIKNEVELIEKHIWHIHGEILKPSSIMLGLDHYCGSIGKIDSYIKGGYSYSKNGKRVKEESIETKFSENKFNCSSWIELFFTSNIHIVGLGLDFSEIDLWWILNKRARLKNGKLHNVIQNEIYFYCDWISEEKAGLLESLNVTIVRKELSDSPNKYDEFYTKVAKSIKEKIESQPITKNIGHLAGSEKVEHEYN
jgi:hypothetical protein